MNTQIQLPPTVAEIQLIYRNTNQPASMPTVTCSEDAYHCFFSSWDQDQIGFREQLRLMLLDRRGRVLGIVDISSGGTSSAIAEPKLIFAAAIRANAASIIMAHNHPTGDCSPSHADNQLTKKLVEAGKLLEIPFNDHLIISDHGYFSYADRGLL